MDNYQIADTFLLLGKLLDIHGENSFKAKSYAVAAFNIEKLPFQLKDISRENIVGIKGIGASTGEKIVELLETGSLNALQEIINKTPAGVIEMLNIKGIGPKKISTIWKEMGIESIGELLYACKENRLKLYKGFGEKTQLNVIETIEFYLHNQGSYLYPQVEAVEPQITAYLEKLFSPGNVFITGSYKRQESIINEIEYVVACNNETVKPKLQSANPPELLEETTDSLLYKLHNGLKLRLYTGEQLIGKKLFTTTGSADFNDVFFQQFPNINWDNIAGDNDKEIFSQAHVNYIPACLRELPFIIARAAKEPLPDLIQFKDMKGIIHAHSNWSDGSNSIEDMAAAAIAKGYEYLVLTDHSKSAFYAQGLTEERIKAQHQCIDELNATYKDFKIFKSIESDILFDGNLDYSNEVLASFDMVIASIHSNLKMTEEKAMQRLMAAIENPYTTVLGHLTGRLLLSRKGYPVDHKKIIDACFANQVVIELNAHPNRLDIDWQHIAYALEKNVLISINPDAHSTEGFNDTRYGVLAAQKAMLTKQQNLSSLGLQAFEIFLQNRKSQKGIN